MLLSCTCRSLIDLPTRTSLTSKTLLDHIYTNNRKRRVVSGVLTCDLSDHYATFAIVSAINKVKKTQNNDYKVRGMPKFNLEIFLNALNDQLNILTDSNISSPHELYDKFVSKFENVVDQFAPMRKASRKENKLRCRPWLTRGLLKSIRIKNKMHNNLREKPDTSQSHKYKIYRNLLNRLIKQAKVDYYHNVLKDNKNNS